MELNKSDRNYLILVLIVIISVFSLKIKPINFRLALKGLVLVFLIYFLFKRDVKVSLFLTLLLFSLNQNGIGNSIDFFENNRDESLVFSGGPFDNCVKHCYLDKSLNMDDCEELCSNGCAIQCSLELKKKQKFSECSSFCSLKKDFTSNRENFKNLESDNRICRIKCLNEKENNLSSCKEFCDNNCINTCTSSKRDFSNCRQLCTQ